MIVSPPWKVLIADDESIIREGILSSLNWQQLGLEVVAEAEDGEEALELARKHSVHILLVDLNMPIMNGMSLIKHIREELPDCKIIIITGHDEFTYAQAAIRLNVDDYILKPVNPAQLADVLTKITKQMASSLEKEEHLQMASKQIERNFSLLRERFCLEWMDGGLSEVEIREQLAFLKMPDRAPSTLGVIQWSGNSRGKELLSERDRQLYLFAIENIVEELLSPYTLVKFRDHLGMLVVLVWEPVPADDIEKIDAAVQTYLKISIASQFLKGIEGVTGVSNVYQQARTSLYKEAHLSPFVRLAKDYIAQRYSDPEITLEMIANEMKVSPVYLGRIFKQELGIPFVNMLTHTRIKHAIHYLSTTDMTIIEISEKVGYDSQHYFSTAFKKVVGIAPNQYRKEGTMQS
ncbi:response regulator transcription factor [Paenibacillus sp. Soil724D2]|uniref:response regulator transcription factor n=1 Tax=Paenibacillus sp. (strain Soil724D2) TaxID=1736392 RepID=UPI000715FA88|nr:response regulator [Paenibacillus sp. Soil724D2]KRE40055.1 AraC family transcriptional regulator [Paenibacillus sp. Soil724D2]